MAITNYGELKDRIIRWAARGDLADVVEDFIRYPHDLIVEQMVVCADLALSSASVNLPGDCREVVAVWPIEGATSPLRPMSPLEMAGSYTGTPQGYRVSNGKLLLAPGPNQAYAGRLQYRLVRDFFEDDDDTNLILDRYPYLYLHGAMAEFARFDKDQATEQTYEGRFRDALAAAINAEIAQGPSAAMLVTASGNVV